MKLKSVLGISIIAAFSLIGCGSDTGSTYDKNGKIEVQKLKDSEKYAIGGSIYKRYYNEEDKIKDIEKNFNNIYHVELNNPNIMPTLYKSIDNQLNMIYKKFLANDKSYLDDAEKFNSDLKLLVYNFKDNKEFDMKKLMNLIVTNSWDKVLIIKEEAISGISNADFLYAGFDIDKVLKEDIKNINKVDERLIGKNTVMGSFFENYNVKFEDLFPQSKMVQWAYFHHKLPEYKTLQFGKEEVKKYINLEEAMKNHFTFSIREGQLEAIKKRFLELDKELEYDRKINKIREDLNSKLNEINIDNILTYDYKMFRTMIEEFITKNNIEDLEEPKKLFKMCKRAIEKIRDEFIINSSNKSKEELKEKLKIFYASENRKDLCFIERFSGFDKDDLERTKENCDKQIEMEKKSIK